MSQPKFKVGDRVNIPRFKVKNAEIINVSEYLPGYFSYRLKGHPAAWVREALLERRMHGQVRAHG